ncbi:hypothetical protein [Metasolibacillus meyeri]|uniref:hypothetical protein n=1 Tax=Metasolibacillus meyeri TaxID=1071052 RepID=UPI000D2FE3C2|nr:hypothetical protein [Metasolibacillus meyeri]
MKKVFFISILIIGFFILIGLLNIDSVSIQDKEQMRITRINSALENVWDTFGLLSVQIGGTDSTIEIVMDDNKSEQGLRNYLTDHINKADLKHYNIEISKKSLEEVKIEMAVGQALSLIHNYINEHQYKDIQIITPYIETRPWEPLLIIKNSETNRITNEALKNEVINLIEGLPTKDIFYEIIVIN